MRFFQVLLIFLASSEPGAFAKSAPQDPRPNSECLVSASELRRERQGSCARPAARRVAFASVSDSQRTATKKDTIPGRPNNQLQC